MKLNIAIVIALIVGVVAGFVMSRQDDGPKALAVHDVSANPGAFAGTINLTGIMGALSKEDPKVFGLIDTEEYKSKGAKGRTLFIPVRCPEKLPALGDEVRLTGNFVRSGPGYEFVAQKLKVIGHHKL